MMNTFSNMRNLKGIQGEKWCGMLVYGFVMSLMQIKFNAYFGVF